MALASLEVATGARRTFLASAFAHLKARLPAAEDLLLQRLAGTVFLIRVVNAALAFGVQILLARLIGRFEFGIYVYVWTWVLVLGQAVDLGLGTTAQRFIPEYRERGAPALLRGFVFASRWVALGAGTAIAAVSALVVRAIEPSLNPFIVIPLYLACAAVPAFAIASVQEGISRSYDWVIVAMMPGYVFRPILVTAFMVLAYLADYPMNAVTAVIVGALALWVPTFAQTFILNNRLPAKIEQGLRRYEFKTWFSTSLPILLVESFYTLLAYSDVLVLQQFRSPDEVAIYFAAAKSVALLAFIYYSVSSTTAHRFSALHTAGDRERLGALIAQSIKWTFWPSLAGAALLLASGQWVLGLFGPHFDSGYHLMFILVLGLLARAAIGPVERILNMMGEQRICAWVHGGALAINIGLCFALIPAFGATGAAVATASALFCGAVMLFLVTRRRLGLHVFICGGMRR
jgi:O-antigen/teichoic acid export membrane protein